MNWPPGDEILIDTNVFKHHCDKDPKYNSDGHVSVLLAVLAANHCLLLVDDADLFRREFQAIVEPQFKRSDVDGEVELLRYWSNPDNQVQKEFISNRELTQSIKTVIIENERIDRAFVYIAFANGRVLVTNDERHIVIGPPSKKERGGNRRQRMMNAAKKHIVKGAAILFSQEAHACLENA